MLGLLFKFNAFLIAGVHENLLNGPIRWWTADEVVSRAVSLRQVRQELDRGMLCLNVGSLCRVGQDLEHTQHLKVCREVLVDQRERLADFLMHRAQQVGSELVEQSRQQNKKPVVEVCRLCKNQLIDSVEEQRVHFDVRIHEHLAEQVEDAVQLVRRQHLALRQILREICESIFAFTPMRRCAILDDCVNVLDELG